MVTSTFCSFAWARGKPTHHLNSGCVVAELREALKKMLEGFLCCSRVVSQFWLFFPYP
jgi:hypothetical protein